MSDFCLVLICPRESEERVLDELLVVAGDAVIVSSPAARHGAHHGQLSNMEKVTGRGLATQIQVLLNEEGIGQLVARLKESFTGKRIQYWVIPAHSAGEL